MSAALVLLLLAPATAALAVSIVPDRTRGITAATLSVVGLGWAVVAARTEAVTAGDLVADPLLAAAAAGLAALALAARSRTVPGAAAVLLVLTALPAAAALDPARLPDRRYAAGVVVVGLLAASRLLVERGSRAGQVAVVAASLVIAAGLVGDRAPAAVALAAAGTIAAVAAALWGPPGRLLLPAGLLALARVAPRRAPDPDVDLVLVVVAAGVALGAVLLLRVAASPVAHRLPLGGVLAAVGLLALDVPELRAAGALLGGGAVLALAGRHPAALVALLPGAVAAVQAAGAATAPEQAAVGAAALAALAAGASGRTGPASRADLGPLTAVAVAFGLVPLWGWAGADTRAHGEAVAVAVAVALPVGIAVVSAAGTIVRRPRAESTHGSAPLAYALAEAQPQEAGPQAP